MLDVFSVSATLFCRVQNCSLSTGIPSDHGATQLLFSTSSIKHSGETKLSRGVTDWAAICMDSGTRDRFNVRLEELNAQTTNDITTSYPQFFENVMRAGADTALRPKPPN